MRWHLCKWSRWRNFTYVHHYRLITDGLPVLQEIREAMQEKTCVKCGKTRQREVL